MTLNPDVVRARCGEIEESIQRLEDLGKLTAEAFLSKQDTLDIACYRLLVAIEAALALCYHVAARQLRKAPEDHAGCFAVLGEAGLIAPDLTERLRRMARFRNLLVHVYWKIDYRQVYEVIRRDLGDLRALAAAVTALLH